MVTTAILRYRGIAALLIALIENTIDSICEVASLCSAGWAPMQEPHHHLEAMTCMYCKTTW